jgi:hypothetical protein
MQLTIAFDEAARVSQEVACPVDVFVGGGHQERAIIRLDEADRGASRRAGPPAAGLEDDDLAPGGEILLEGGLPTPARVPSHVSAGVPVTPDRSV